MSADNWAQCPACLKRAEDTQEAKQKAVEEAYGKVPIAEWDAMRAEAEKEIEVGHTFREDYETGLWDNEIYVRYSGYCTECGTGTDFTDHRPITMKKLP